MERRQVFVREPFATYFNTDGCRRMELIARIVNKLSVPKGEVPVVVSMFVIELYDMICDHHDLGIGDVRPEGINRLVTNVLLSLEPDEVVQLAKALRLKRERFTVDLHNYQQQAVARMADQLVPRVGDRLRRMRQPVRSR